MSAQISSSDYSKIDHVTKVLNEWLGILKEVDGIEDPDVVGLVNHCISQLSTKKGVYSNIIESEDFISSELIEIIESDKNNVVGYVYRAACMLSMYIYIKTLVTGTISSSNKSDYYYSSFIPKCVNNDIEVGDDLIYKFYTEPYYRFTNDHRRINRSLKETLASVEGAAKQNLDNINKEKEVVAEIIKKYIEVRDASYAELADAFHGFRERKEEEKGLALRLTVIIGIGIILVAIATMSFGNLFGDILGSFTEGKILSHGTVSMIVVEIMMIYFFRISLQGYYAARDECLQLDIRESLCKFAPHYSVFSGQASGNLEDFARHVFSPLVSRMNDTPHPVDIVGNIGKVAKEITKQK